MRRIVAAVALSLAACASLSKDGERVRVASMQDAAACRYVGDVTAPPPYGLPGDAEKKLRNLAADLGGDLAVTNVPIVGFAKAHVYRCAP